MPVRCRRHGPKGEEEAEALLGRAMLERREFARARNHFKQALQRLPESLTFRLLYSHALLKEGIDDQATEAALLQVLALEPNHPEAKSNLAVIRSKRAQILAGVPSASSRILLLCPDNDVPSGGVRRLYRHADVLCATACRRPSCTRNLAFVAVGLRTTRQSWQ